MAQQGDSYPVRLAVEYPEGERNRLTVFFRLFAAIPIFVVMVFVAGSSSNDDGGEYATLGAGGVVFFAPLLMILFRQKYPRWWFDWNVQFQKFAARFAVYFLLMRDEYPSTDDEQAVAIEIPYPDVEQDLNRWLPLVKWLFAIPHIIVLIILWTFVIVVSVIAWFAILVGGSYPRGFFDFVEGVMRWSIRVQAYAVLLSTDEYPPFSLKA